MIDVARGVIRFWRKCYHKARTTSLRINGVVADADVRVFGPLKVNKTRGSVIVIGKGVTLNASVKRNTLESRGANILKTLHKDARITIGDLTGMTSTTISSASSVSIGRNVLLGAGVLITDSDHHVVLPPSGVSRRFLGLPEGFPDHGVVIADDVFIGARSIVLKGVTIGEGSVVGAGSVVTRNLPPYVIAAGNPCRVIKIIKE